MARSLAVGIAIVMLPTLAGANPHPLPFSYGYETLPEDELELEQTIDLMPSRVAVEQPDGTLDSVTDVGAKLQTEVEFGITDHLEAGFYFTFKQEAGASPTLQFDGVKQRLRYRIGEADDLPVNLGIYLEISEFHDELELEQKLLLAKRFGDLNLIANLWVEQEYAWQSGAWEYFYNPTAGATYELSTKLAVGLEYWARGRFDKSEDGTREATHHYLGPTVQVQSGKAFLSVGAYLGLDQLGDPAVTGDPYGKLWIRTVLGVDL
ncbi:MAG: hypothetical protein NT062_31135 [Proteobacteria bacterium]|nr:hypothetical protein [Pseudomonadota bacterium]